MKIVKYIKHVVITAIFLWWFFLSHVTFFFSYKNFEMNNGDFIAKYYYVLPVNIIGIYSWIFHYQPEYVVLYDKEYNYIGQSSPFCLSNGIAGGEHILPEKKLMSKNKYYAYLNVSGGRCQDEYTIPVKEKKWWSQILQYFHL
ncbi:DUF6201 family protein [Xenorhabdus sp. PR6a]|uniref:DUF6201 family protein n=1 Tax=Xenorhabdus sp. PR6a TaxID=3025877 RepID=UPI00235824A4|nr:DUF6201 family protein [Xenorhabdus sp. PR6a]MDC9583272.1 DUF6201 family protein [Xenorhabdus sp. PR6a]